MIAAVNVLITDIEENKLLVVKRVNNDENWPDMLALPGGHIEKQESLEEAAKREILEETGYELLSINTPPIASMLLVENDDNSELVLVRGSIGKKVKNKLDTDIVSALWVEPITLIYSLKEHNFPAEQISNLCKILEEEGLTI